MAKYVPPRRQALAAVATRRIDVLDLHRPPSQRQTRSQAQRRAEQRFEEFATAADWTDPALVQPIKRLQHGEPHNGQDEYAFLEFQLDAATPGWLRSSNRDWVAFERYDGFLLAPRQRLLQLLDQGGTPIRSYRFPRQIRRKLYAPDVEGYPTGLMLTLVSLPQDVMPLDQTLLLVNAGYKFNASNDTTPSPHTPTSQ